MVKVEKITNPVTKETVIVCPYCGEQWEVDEHYNMKKAIERDKCCPQCESRSRIFNN